jgi:16S rRNA (uracil1498-N3)-methyltransferase
VSDYFYITPPTDGFIRIDEAEAKHLVKVLRYVVGDVLYFTDGRGMRYTARLESTDYFDCFARIENQEIEFGKRPYHLHIGISPTKNMDRFEWFLEKSTEIGIDEITPMICSRSERKDFRTDRLDKILVSAMKQSSQCYLPKLNPVTPFQHLMNSTHDQRFICHLDKEHPLSLGKKCHPGGSVLLMIGPEGDFTPDELNLAKEHSLHCVALGPTRLRTETAGVVACTIISQVNSH